jgi:UDP-GlcNAc:undecaprenyl-phosphate GlcNAc-1-phosphate transferase
MELFLSTPISAMLSSCLALFILHPIAHKIGLVDIANEARKDHKGSVPLIGGISVWFGLVVALFTQPAIMEEHGLFLVAVTAIGVMGVMDDYYPLPPALRLFFQAAISGILIIFSGIHINYLGTYFGYEVLMPEWLSLIFSIAAFVGAINAYNMIDGIDGLLGSFGILALGTLGSLFFMAGDLGLSAISFTLALSCVPFLFFNMGWASLKRFKTLMGDAGSMMIGLSIVWLIAHAVTINESGTAYFPPALGLFIVSLPLMDMTIVMISRKRRGRSPFRPDRTHLHHIFQAFGLSKKGTLIAMIDIYVAIIGVGISMIILDAPDWATLGLFFVMGTYFVMLRHFMNNRVAWYRRLLQSTTLTTMFRDSKVRQIKKEVVAADKKATNNNLAREELLSLN